MFQADHRFRRVNSHLHLPKLPAALEARLTTNAVPQTTSHARRTGTDRRVAIMPARGPIWTTLNGIQVSMDL